MHRTVKVELGSVLIKLADSHIVSTSSGVTVYRGFYYAVHESERSLKQASLIAAYGRWEDMADAFAWSP